MLGGKGYYRGSTILASGTAGTGKTSVASTFVKAACERGERCLYFAFEESPDQILRNMRSIGVELAQHVERGSLRIVPSRPTAHGLEMHLVAMHKLVTSFDPDVVVLDPVTNLVTVGTSPETRSMLVRLIDFLKLRQVTSFFTSLTHGDESLEESDVGISSLIDSWLVLSMVRSGGERNRTLSIVKSRGMPHSNQAAEYRLTSKGMEIVDTYVGSAGVLTGSARIAQEASDAAARLAQEEEGARKREEHERRRKALERQMAALRDEIASEEAEVKRREVQEKRRHERLALEGRDLARSRKAFATQSSDDQGSRR
jgi:circadian clock protein KaiC